MHYCARTCHMFVHRWAAVVKVSVWISFRKEKCKLRWKRRSVHPYTSYEEIYLTLSLLLVIQYSIYFHLHYTPVTFSSSDKYSQRSKTNSNQWQSMCITGTSSCCPCAFNITVKPFILQRRMAAWAIFKFYWKVMGMIMGHYDIIFTYGGFQCNLYWNCTRKDVHKKMV